MSNAVFCTVKNYDQANQIVTRLKDAGFSNNDISVLMSDREETNDFARETETKAPEGAAAGAGADAVLGGGLGWLAGIGALAIPGIGPVIAAGPIMAALSGAAIGGAVGGLTGALIGLGIPEEEAPHYEAKVKGGDILISVHSEDPIETQRAQEIFASGGAGDVMASNEAQGSHRL